MKLSKLSRASPYMPSLELCLRLSAEGEFTTAPRPSAELHTPTPTGFDHWSNYWL